MAPKTTTHPGTSKWTMLRGEVEGEGGGGGGGGTAMVEEMLFASYHWH